MTGWRRCPTCGDADVVLERDRPYDGWSELTCKSCARLLEIDWPGVGQLVDPQWVASGDEYGRHQEDVT